MKSEICIHRTRGIIRFIFLPIMMILLLTGFRNIRIRNGIFSLNIRLRHMKREYKGNPVNNELFNKSLETCNGLLTGGGFEGPAEALYLGKSCYQFL